MQNFVHLRAHSEFSVTDGILRIKNIVKSAHSDGMYSIALTDLHNMFGFVKFYKECLKIGIKPVLGSEINIEGTLGLKYKIILLAKNNSGLILLNTLITRSYI